MAALAGSLWWTLFVGGLLVVAALEWARMAGAPDVLFVLTLVGSFAVVVLGNWSLLPAFVLLPAVPLLYFQDPDRGLDAVWSAGGILWLAVPAAFLALVHRDFGIDALLVLMVGTILQDTFAYFSGYLFGGDTPFTPRLSPNKTWAGFMGGVLGITLVLVAGGRFMGWLLAVTLPAGLVLGVTGQAGDLSISALKRQLGIDDTGSIFPGHGGILDRVDGLVFNVVLFYPLCEFVEDYGYSVLDFLLRNGFPT